MIQVTGKKRLLKNIHMDNLFKTDSIEPLMDYKKAATPQRKSSQVTAHHV